MPKIRPRLDRLAETINTEHEAAERSRAEALEHFRAAGVALIEARKLCAHGKWLKWLKANVRCGKTQAYRYIAWAEIPVTGTLEEQEAAWRRICGNVRTDSTDNSPRDEPPLDIDDDEDTGDETDPSDLPKPPPEIRNVALRLPVEVVGEFESMVQRLYDVFGTDNVSDTAIEAVRFAYKENVDAARLETV